MLQLAENYYPAILPSLELDDAARQSVSAPLAFLSASTVQVRLASSIIIGLQRPAVPHALSCPQPHSRQLRRARRGAVRRLPALRASDPRLRHRVLRPRAHPCDVLRAVVQHEDLPAAA